MRPYFLLLILLINSAAGWCKCMSRGLYFWPTGPTICENSLIIVDAYAQSQAMLTGSTKKYTAYLQSDHEKIELLPIALYVGQFDLTQVILKPQKSLIAGGTYELIVEGVDDVENLLKKFNSKTNQWEKISWKVVGEADLEAPVWKKLPAYINDTYIEYGCGPEVSANFEFEVSDISEYLIKTTVKDLSTQQVCTYCIQPSNQVISIGHGMCSGAFYLDNGHDFEVEFILMDASGNETPWTSPPLSFKNPLRH